MVTAYVKKLVTIAEEQYNSYHFESESDVELSKQIRKYWTDLGFSFPGVTTAWSAIFISWCIKMAGATQGEFLFNPAHAQFVYVAIQHAIKQTGVFRAYPYQEIEPNLGDLIHHNRGGKHYDFEFAKHNKTYESHSAIVVEKGTDVQGHYVLTIGGNESDSIRKKLVRLDDQKKIISREINPYICIIQNQK
ncbi:DUF2272 domain-containing protein [Olivibacter sp. CPCC 100613]|uniref:DUF2272 domain-containing protein n=1 Tax=Olivibacter sp. CPCC 100613 TaxID=3079931 RepID=UPI002FF5EEF3